MGFNVPDWAGEPKKKAWVQVVAEGREGDTIPVDGKSFYLFGRDAGACDITLPHDSTSRIHAALVHHKDGRLYLIDLSTGGSSVDGSKIAKHKPLQLYHKSVMTFGSCRDQYVLHCEEAGAKRGGDAGSSGKRSKSDEVVRASHLLVKHKDVRRPSSWKESVVSRTKEEALELIEKFREQLVNEEVSFAELASRESHCSSASRGGDLGEFGRGKMQPAFEEGAFALKVGELSEPVFSDSGVHLILRTS